MINCLRLSQWIQTWWWREQINKWSKLRRQDQTKRTTAIFWCRLRWIRTRHQWNTRSKTQAVLSKPGTPRPLSIWIRSSRYKISCCQSSPESSSEMRCMGIRTITARRRLRMYSQRGTWAMNRPKSHKTPSMLMWLAMDKIQQTLCWRTQSGRNNNKRKRIGLLVPADISKTAKSEPTNASCN